MKYSDVKPIPNAGYFTAFVFDHGINMLVRSADWYKLPAIQRYLYNMAAKKIRMEDAKTESRSYTFERFDQLRDLIDRSATDEWSVAFEAFRQWDVPELTFGVVHLDQEDGRRGNLLLGDDPNDYSEFFPDHDLVEIFDPATAPQADLGGSHV